MSPSVDNSLHSESIRIEHNIARRAEIGIGLTVLEYSVNPPEVQSLERENNDGYFNNDGLVR